MARPLVFNLVVSNVPGPQQPLYLLGRRIREIYPYVPLSPQNHAVSLGLISYDGRVFFGLAGDRDVVPDLDDFAAALRAACASSRSRRADRRQAEAEGQSQAEAQPAEARSRRAHSRRARRLRGLRPNSGSPRP